MTKTQHTPGPWSVQVDELDAGTYYIEECGKHEEAAQDPGLAHANARLIETAPELLATCEDVLRLDYTKGNARKVLKAVIAKVRGAKARGAKD